MVRQLFLRARAMSDPATSVPRRCSCREGRHVKALPDDQKLRGGYYTPHPLADALVEWAVRSHTDRVLEPSCGDGAILVSAARRALRLGADPASIALNLTGVELDGAEAAKALSALTAAGAAATLVYADFFSHVLSE